MDFNKYKINWERIERPIKPKTPGINGTSAEFHKYADDLAKWEKDMDIYNDNHKQRRIKEQEIQDQFKNDLLDELGLSDHPKAEAFYNICYEHAHSSGYQEIYNFAETIAQLLY